MSEPIWIEADLVLAIHYRQLAEHGGLEGGRDEALLHSALPRPLNPRLYANADIITLAAKYTAGIVKNHPFVDGNKRTGFVVGVLFLELNGYRFAASEVAAARAITEIADGTLDEVGYATFLREHVATERAPADRPR